MLRTLRKSFGPLPRDGERGDGAGAGAADAVPLGILGDVVFLVEHRHQLVDDHARVLVVERVVLGRPIGRPVAPFLRRRLRLLGCAARVDEDGQHDRQLAAIDQVVEDVRGADVALHVLERLAVVEDHQAGRHRLVVLRRHVDPVRVLRPRVGLARERERPAHFALGDAFARERIRAELIVRVVIDRGRCGRGRWLSGRRRLHRRLLREGCGRRDADGQEEGQGLCHK